MFTSSLSPEFPINAVSAEPLSEMADENVAGLLKNLSAESRHIISTELAGATLMLFDWSLTFTSEVESIWKAEWNLIKVLYLITRYLPLAFIPPDLFYLFTGSLSISGCVAVYDTLMVMFVISLLSAELLFTIRTVAVWGGGQRVAYILFGAFSLMFIAIPTLTGINLSRTTQEFIGFKHFIQGQCVPGSDKSYKFLVATFAFTAAYDTFILMFMLMRGVSTHYTHTDLRLLKTIYGDGAAFYVYIFGVSMANIIAIFVLNDFFLLLQASVHSVLACRVVLHIRRRLKRVNEASDGSVELRA